MHISTSREQDHRSAPKSRLTLHTTRCVADLRWGFDRYNIVNEQELLTAGQRLATYLADEQPKHVRGAA
jgi:hypothetical protein